MEGHRVTLGFKSLRSNLVNLPSPLCNLLYNANINIQDVIIEIVPQTLNSSTKCYAGWSGMSSSSIDILEIDPIFAESLNLSEKDKAVLNLKLDNYESTSISLEPESSSDWELVELHAQTLEDKLLSQSRCVSIGQTLVVYPSQTSSAKLIVTDIGSKDHKYAKISPSCEVSIAPKVRRKVSASKPSAKNLKTSSQTEDYSTLPTVLKRGISLPHKIYDIESPNYQVYVNYSSIPKFLVKSKYVAVSVIPGPLTKLAISDKNTNSATPNQGKDKEKPSQLLKENKRVVAKLVNYKKSPHFEVGLSNKLAIALGCENQNGNIIVLQPAIQKLSKNPSTLVVHPYITQTKKNSSINLSQSKKEKDSKIADAIMSALEFSDCLTNYTKIPIIPGYLPQGGLLKFKRNDETNAWFLLEKKVKLELGEELLRNESFIQAPSKDSSLSEKAIGLDKLENDIIDNITNTKNCGCLIFGNSGSGKTLLSKIVSHKLSMNYGYHIKFVSCESIMNENFHSLSNNHISKWLQECSWHKPSLLVLDNVDKILPVELENSDSTQSIQSTEYFIAQLAKIHSQRDANVSILMTAPARESVNKLLSQSHSLEQFYQLSAPDKSKRHDIIKDYLIDTLGCQVDFDIMDISNETEGYLPNDLKILSDRIYHEVLFNGHEKATKPIFETALKGYTPSNLRGVKLEKSTTGWSDIGGLTEAKSILLETLEWPTKYAPIFANCPLRLRSGILLYGYPGCGKTLLASAIAGQCGLNFISVKGPEILNKYIGASEQSVRELFERAQSAKPCILFFDEFDSIAPKRGHDSTGVTDRVVNQMLTQMDGAEGLDGVYVLAATSRPDLIDSALLRPGRLDKSVICDMPNYYDRLDILKTITAKMDLDKDVDLESLAEKTGGFSGADMQGLGYNAYLKAVHTKLENDEKAATSTSSTNSSSNTDNYEFVLVNSEKLKNSKLRPSERVQILSQIKGLLKKDEELNETKNLKSNTGLDSSIVTISQKDFEESLKETKPSISASELKKLSGIYRKFVSGRDGNMPDGTPSSEIGGRTSLM